MAVRFLIPSKLKWGRALRDQTIALELGKAQLIEVAPGQARSAGIEKRQSEQVRPGRN